MVEESVSLQTNVAMVGKPKHWIRCQVAERPVPEVIDGRYVGSRRWDFLKLLRREL
jgi:hypothetical protein